MELEKLGKIFDKIYITKNVQEDVDQLVKTKIIDSRSLMFYALGTMKKEQKTVIVMKKAELYNAYTALVEIFYKKKNVNICVLNDKKEDFLEFYRIAQIKNITVDSLNHNLINNSGIQILNIIDYEQQRSKKIISFNNQLKDYDIWTNGINVDFNNNKLNFDIGALSFMFGIAEGNKKNNNLLIISEEQLLKEVNVFQIRYKPKNLKILIISKKGTNLENWILKNSFKYIRSNELDFSLFEQYDIYEFIE